MRRGIKKKDYEKLSDSNIQETIKLLESWTQFTKKEACQKLNIAYNTTRLQRIIDEHLERVSFVAKRKAQNKGKPATQDEIISVVEYYLKGENISTIAKNIYRSDSFIKAIIKRVGIPEKASKEEHSKYYNYKYPLLPEQCVAEEFQAGEKVWSVKDNAVAEIRRENTAEYRNSMPGYMKPAVDYEEKYGAKGYDLYVFTPVDTSGTFFPWLDGSRVGYHSFALAYDIGSLKHLEELGIDPVRL